MDIARLREYIALSRRLNFTATAKEMHLSQPALSNHIHALEREVGFTLVERSFSNGVRLTPSGQRFLEAAKQMIAAYDTAMDDLREMQRTIDGKIRIRTPRHEYGCPLLDYIYEFRNEYPNIDIVLSPWTAEDGYSDVASGKVDCAYVGQAPELEDGEGVPGVKQVPYGKQEALLWVDCSHPLAARTAVAIGDLDGCCLTIPANQKSESWVRTMSSMAHERGIGVSFNEKYCDSLEDFLMNKVGPGDLVINYAGLFDIPGIDMRSNRILRSFDPPVMLRSSVAYADRPNDLAIQLFARFLKGKYDGV